MDVLEKDEFLKAYRNISAQLKKKFVRKPNVTDAVDGFDSLGRKQLDLGFVELSAACRLAAAQLEQAVGANTSINSSQRSGMEYNNLFLETARTYSQSTENANTYTCYEAAINSTSDSCLSWMTSMEAGQTALLQGDYQNATGFLTKAFKLAETQIEKSLSGEKLASSYICQGLFAEALRTLSVTKTGQNNRITLLLLALNLKNCINGDSKLSHILADLIERPFDSIQPPKLQYSLNSLKLGELDETVIQVVWSYLSIDQQQLLLCLIHQN